MKKLILAITLIVILVVAGFGSVVMADSPPNPKPPDSWNLTVDGINDILNKIGTFSSLGTIADALEAIYDEVVNGLGAIDSKVTILSDNESAMARIMSDQGIVDMTVAEDNAMSDVQVYESPTFYEGAHFTVTVWIIDGDDSLDHVKVHHAHLVAE